MFSAWPFRADDMHLNPLALNFVAINWAPALQCFATAVVAVRVPPVRHAELLRERRLCDLLLSAAGVSNANMAYRSIKINIFFVIWLVMGLSHVTLWDFSLTIHDSNMFLDCVQVKSTWIKSIWKFRKRISHIAIIKPVYYSLLQHQFINENQFNIYNIYIYIFIFILYIYIRRFDFASPPFFSRGVVYISCVKNLMRCRDILTPRSMSGPDATTRCLIMLDNRPPWNEKRLQRRQRGEKGRFFGFREIDGIIENAWKCFFWRKGYMIRI